MKGPDQTSATMNGMQWKPGNMYRTSNRVCGHVCCGQGKKKLVRFVIAHAGMMSEPASSLLSSLSCSFHYLLMPSTMDDPRR